MRSVLMFLKIDYVKIAAVVLGTVIIFFGCKEEEETQSPECTIIEPDFHADYIQTDVVNITVEASDNDNDLEEIRLYINGIGVARSVEDVLQYEYHPEETTGNIKILAEAWDKENQFAEDEILINVGSAAPIADFEVSQTTVEPGEVIEFTDKSTLLPTKWQWVFQDGTTSWEQNPTHSFPTGGEFPVKLIASNEYGSDSTQITIICNGPGVTDIEGNQYETTTIGDQVWFAENLRVTTYNDGQPINFTIGDQDWLTNSANYCWPADNVAYAESWGALYNFYVVETDKICPHGWHVPSHDEFMQMIDYVSQNGQNPVAIALKANSGWPLIHNTNGNGTDEFGFSLLPNGWRWWPHGDYDGGIGTLWTSTANDQFSAHYIEIWYNNDYTFHMAHFHEWGFGIRCIKD